MSYEPGGWRRDPMSRYKGVLFGMPLYTVYHEGVVNRFAMRDRLQLFIEIGRAVVVNFNRRAYFFNVGGFFKLVIEIVV